MKHHVQVHVGPTIIAVVLILLCPKNDNLSIAYHTFVPKILYESERLLAIDKPAGISHHNDEQTGELGIVSRLRGYYHAQNQQEQRLWAVHRLDRVTSGILLFAKDAEMAGLLGKAFRDNNVIKFYIGISNKKASKKKQGYVKGEMVRGRRKSWYLTTTTTTTNSNHGETQQKSPSNTTGGNFASTRFFTAGLGGFEASRLQPWADTTESNDSSLLVPKTCLLFRPHTGKTHQLRVAAKSLGLPLLGDPVYNNNSNSKGDSSNLPRTFLHATAIHLVLDQNDSGMHHEPVTIWCPPPFGPLLWEEDAQNSFDKVVLSLFRKHCECSEILSAITS